MLLSRRHGRVLVAFTPAVQLETLFVLNEAGRIVSTREPNPSPGPRFSIIRDEDSCVWAVHADVAKDLAERLAMLAREEPPTEDFRRDPLHALEYVSLLAGRLDAGPAFTFPPALPSPRNIVVIDRIEQLTRYLRGWTADELPERAPILGIVDGNDAVSVCFCARRSARVAEAGLETVESYRGGGLGARVTAAWALAIRASGRLALYSTSWNNGPSLAVARKLGLHACASNWNVW